MNSSDMATYEDELENMGVLVMSDECRAIEQFVTFFKYCIPISTLIVIVVELSK